MEQTKNISQNFIKKNLNGVIPTSVAFVILYFVFQIMIQLSNLHKQISELRASILTREVVHQISRQQCEKFYREVKNDIQDAAYRKILQFHKKMQ